MRMRAGMLQSLLECEFFLSEVNTFSFYPIGENVNPIPIEIQQ
jgi:hypothetical protein